ELYSIYLKKDSHLSPYGLGKLVSSSNTEKKFKITHLSRCVEEHSDAFLYRYSSVNNTDQQIISVYDPETQRNLPFGALKFVVSGGLDKDNLENRVQKAITVGAYHLLYYQKNNKSGGRGEPKYIVRIDKTSGQLDRPIVTFLRYIRVNGNKVDYVRDKNCGKQFDLKEYNFFRLDRELSAKEIVSFLELVLV
ncbi:MAG: hypothetical protein OEZ36_08005, partial [Spirochaetota bacterium]|nr:hypothetical protein [Spirochaetota bacterium]